MTSRHVRGDDGQLAPLASIFVVVSLVSLGLLFLQYSRGTDLRGGAQTAADAAALAAAKDYAGQVEDLLDGPGLGRVISFLRTPTPDRASMYDAAARLAAANDSQVQDFRVQGNQVAVLARTDRQVPDEPAPVDGDRKARSAAQARASFPLLETCEIVIQPLPSPPPLPSLPPLPLDPLLPPLPPLPPPPPLPPLPDLLVCDGLSVDLPLGRLAGSLRDRLLEVEVRLVPVTATLR